MSRRTASIGLAAFLQQALKQPSCPLCFANTFPQTGSLEAHIKKYHPWFYDEWKQKHGGSGAEPSFSFSSFLPHASDDSSVAASSPGNEIILPSGSKVDKESFDAAVEQLVKLAEERRMQK
jgi:AICAR transformylase/IMP cyclohydrolase PurH